MDWFKVYMVIPGTDGDAGNGLCEPTWWSDMIRTDGEQKAIEMANSKHRRLWETPGAMMPSDKEMGYACPVCTNAVKVTDAEYADWEKMMQETSELPFN